MSWRTTGILFLVLLFLSGIVYWQSRQEDEAALAPTVAPPVQAPNPFDGASAQSVERLDIQRAGPEEISASFRRQEDGAWFMTTPTATQVISSTVTNTLRTLIGAGSRRVLAPDENPLQVYGLEDPDQSLTIAVRREQDLVQYRLFVGNSTPADDAYYTVKEGDSRIYLISKSALDNVLNLADNPPLPQPMPGPETPSPVP